ATTVARALATVGVPFAVAGRVGNDLYGRFLLEGLDRLGVGTRGVVRDPEAPPRVPPVPVDSAGERSFIHHFGANARFQSTDVSIGRDPSPRALHVSAAFVL